MKKHKYPVISALLLLILFNPLHGRDVTKDLMKDAFPDAEAFMNEFLGRTNGGDYSSVRLPAPSGTSSEFKGMGETVFFKKDSAWTVESYKIIGSKLPASNFIEAVSIKGLFLVVTYLVRNDSQSAESILESPQISDEQGNHYDAYNMEGMYIKGVMYSTSKTISLEQLNPQITYKFSAIYPIPDAKKVLMFNARELGSIVPNTISIYLVDKDETQKAAVAEAKADEVRRGMPKDSAEAIKYLRQLANQGDAVVKNAAIKYLRQLANQGNADAQSNLGVMYGNGLGVPKDYTEAAKWSRLAADQGNANAQHNLGVMYANGEGVPKDDTEAVKWWRLAADQGNALAQEAIVQAYTAAAMRGDVTAQNLLGDLFATGKVVAQDYVEAVEWYSRAAQQGNTDAQRNLGLMYREGTGVPKDLKEAYIWLLAANAIEDLEKVEKELTTEQKAKALNTIAEGKLSKKKAALIRKTLNKEKIEIFSSGSKARIKIFPKMDTGLYKLEFFSSAPNRLLAMQEHHDLESLFPALVKWDEWTKAASENGFRASGDPDNDFKNLYYKRLIWTNNPDDSHFDVYAYSDRSGKWVVGNSISVSKGYLGVQTQELTIREAEGFGLPKSIKGVVITEAFGPAAKAGLKREDIITEINDKRVSTTVYLYYVLARALPGTKVTVKYIRAGKPESKEVTLGKRPNDDRSPVKLLKLQLYFSADKKGEYSLLIINPTHYVSTGKGYPMSDDDVLRFIKDDDESEIIIAKIKPYHGTGAQYIKSMTSVIEKIDERITDVGNKISAMSNDEILAMYDKEKRKEAERNTKEVIKNNPDLIFK